MNINQDFYSPAMNNGHHVFVFGSNLAGIHGAGAARTAYDHWGAIKGSGVGRQGMSYAIPTKDARIQTLPLGDIQHYVLDFLMYAGKHPKLTFLITKVGCGLAGYRESQISPLFETVPDNCILPRGWRRA